MNSVRRVLGAPGPGRFKPRATENERLNPVDTDQMIRDLTDKKEDAKPVEAQLVVARFRAVRNMNGFHQIVTIEVLDYGPDQSTPRYRAMVRSNDGAFELGRPSPTPEGAITGISWTRMDADHLMRIAGLG